jgi:hypothetical protein
MIESASSRVTKEQASTLGGLLPLLLSLDDLLALLFFAVPLVADDEFVLPELPHALKRNATHSIVAEA